MKLELKHLAPYLPYGLKLKINTSIGTFDRNFELDCGHDFNLHLSQGNVKPILRPISDFNKEITINGNTFIPAVMLGFTSNLKKFDLQNFSENIQQVSYVHFMIFIEYHFDVFGLIPAGLAISIHDVGQVVA
jgi:hypothetical protein